jgi:hypothetical protein
MPSQRQLDVLAHKSKLRLKFREFIQQKFEVTVSTTTTIFESVDFLQEEIKACPQEKQLLIDAFEKEISPVVALLKIKLKLQP